MSSDERDGLLPPEAKKEVETTATPDRPEYPVILRNTSTPAPIEPEALVEAFRYLQERIPDIVQLSIREERSMARAAYLDPEFVDAGIHAADVWREAKQVLLRSGAELREEADEIRRWDAVERELQALVKGVADANLKRKHALGRAILTVYRILGLRLRDGALATADAYLRPHYDAMKRAYLRTLKKSRKRGKNEEPEDGEAPE